MQIFLTAIQVGSAVLLILIILMQQGSGGGLSGMFGGGSGMDDMLSTPSGDVFFRKATITLAAVFLLTSLLLAVRTSRIAERSLLERRSEPIPLPFAEDPGEDAEYEGFDILEDFEDIEE